MGTLLKIATHLCPNSHTPYPSFFFIFLQFFLKIIFAWFSVCFLLLCPQIIGAAHQILAEKLNEPERLVEAAVRIRLKLR